MKNIFPKAPQQSDISEQQQLRQLLKSNPELMKKCQEEMTKMQSSQKNKKNTQPLTSKQYIEAVKKSELDKFLDDQGGLKIKPDEGFVLKFLEMRSNQKVFVNILSHQVVDNPQQKLLVDFDNQLGLRIPMSMGSVKQDRDKSGSACKVVDVVMNPLMIQASQTNLQILKFMGQVISSYLLQKYKIAVSEECTHYFYEAMKRIKGLKYKGTDVQIHRVRGKKVPKIQQIFVDPTPQDKKRQSEQQKLFNEISGQYDHEKKLSRPDFRFYIQTLQGIRNEYFFDSFKKDQSKMVIIEIDLSLLIHSRGIHLQGSLNYIYLSVKGFYELCLKMPIQIQSYKSRFSLKQRKLVIEGTALRPRLNQNIEIKDNVVNFNDFSQGDCHKKSSKPIQLEFENQLLDQIV